MIAGSPVFGPFLKKTAYAQGRGGRIDRIRDEYYERVFKF